MCDPNEERVTAFRGEKGSDFNPGRDGHFIATKKGDRNINYIVTIIVEKPFTTLRIDKSARIELAEVVAWLKFKSAHLLLSPRTEFCTMRFGWSGASLTSFFTKSPGGQLWTVTSASSKLTVAILGATERTSALELVAL
jgi:hypothetical protein